MYLGQHQVGKTLDLYLQCTDADGVKAMPTYVPFIKVWIGSSLIIAAEMPLVDKNIQVGLFRFPLFLGVGFSAGHGTAEMHYRVGNKIGMELRTFEIVAGGHVSGQVLGSFFYRRPQANFIVYQTESGEIRRGKNPRVA